MFLYFARFGLDMDPAVFVPLGTFLVLLLIAFFLVWKYAARE